MRGVYLLPGELVAALHREEREALDLGGAVGMRAGRLTQRLHGLAAHAHAALHARLADRGIRGIRNAFPRILERVARFASQPAMRECRGQPVARLGDVGIHAQGGAKGVLGVFDLALLPASVREMQPGERVIGGQCQGAGRQSVVAQSCRLLI